jgi:hypothetical protein
MELKRRYKVTFIKTIKILGTGQSQIMYLAEQIYLSDSVIFNIDVPPGYQILNITEYLPDHIIKSDKNKPSA